MTPPPTTFTPLCKSLTLNRVNRHFLCGAQKQSRAIIRVAAVTGACGETDRATGGERSGLYSDGKHLSVVLVFCFSVPVIGGPFDQRPGGALGERLLICSIPTALRSDCALPKRGSQTVFEPLLCSPARFWYYSRPDKIWQAEAADLRSP